MTVFISTSRFRANPEEIYSAATSWRLLAPTSYPPALIKASRRLLTRIYKPGYIYSKAGIFLTDIVPDCEMQQSVFKHPYSVRQMQLMETIDQINRKHGRHTVRPLAMGLEQPWQMKRGHLSKNYTTRWDELLIVRA